METPPRRQQRRLSQLDGVRALAIVSVFLHHAFHVRLLWMGVDLFFVLSGFLITSILYGSKGGRFRDYIGHFYGRRVRRIIPPYVIVLVISGIVFGVGWFKYWYFYIGAMNFLAPLHLPNLSTLPLWSLAVEEQFYLFWPFAVFYLDRKRLVQLTVFLMVLTPVLRYACTPLFAKHWAIYMLLPFRMDTLAAGAFFALTWPQVRERVGASRRLRWAICGCGLLAMTAALITLELLSRRGVTTYGNTALGNSLIYEMALILVSAVFLLALIGIGEASFKHLAAGVAGQDQLLDLSDPPNCPRSAARAHGSAGSGRYACLRHRNVGPGRSTHPWSGARREAAGSKDRGAERRANSEISLGTMFAASVQPERTRKTHRSAC